MTAENRIQKALASGPMGYQELEKATRLRWATLVKALHSLEAKGVIRYGMQARRSSPAAYGLRSKREITVSFRGFSLV